MPAFLKTHEFLKRQEIADIRIVRFPEHPPWRYPPLIVDLELKEAGPKRENADWLQMLAKNKTADYGKTCRIFTDASKDNDNNIGIGVIIQQPDREAHLSFSFRLDGDLSIHCGELVAIRTALEKAIELDIHGVITLFTDSQSALASLQRSDSNTRQDIVDSIFCLLAKLNVTFVWIPSHLGVDGNELADDEANRGRLRPTIDITVGKQLENGYKIAFDVTMASWQQRWTSSTKARHYYSIQPTLTVATRRARLCRKKSTVINRLRFGICALNQRLHKIGRAASPLCSTCGEVETIAHYLLECTGNPATRKLQERCEMWHVHKTVVSVLSDARTMDFIATTFTRNI
jgi:ribonuclease HI